MPTWTLFIDESGKIDDQGAEREHLGYVLGGVLCPGEHDSLSTPWRAEVNALRSAHGLSVLHATELPGGLRREVQTAVGRIVAASNGRWIAVVDRPDASDPSRSLRRYVGMLASVVDLAARVVALEGGTHLDLCVATRSLPMPADTLQAIGRTATAEITGGNARFTVDVEVRTALDALGRESHGELPRYPVVGTVVARSAASPDVHPGVLFADVLCNRLRAACSEKRKPLAEALGPMSDGGVPAAWTADFDATHTLRDLDRCLRDDPPDLVRAGRNVAELESRVRGWPPPGSAPPRWTFEGAAALAGLLWHRAMYALADRPAPRLARTGAALLGGADALLAAKGGNYEATWRALNDAWASDFPLATRVREATPSVPAARLWRAVMECANHRGDVAQTERASLRAEELFARGVPLSLLGERLLVRNLRVVSLQNRLPVEDGAQLDDLAERLRDAVGRLGEAAEQAAEVLEYAGAPEPDPARDDLPPALRALVDAAAVADRRCDLEVGRAIGTMARTHAFLGEHDVALRSALRARRHFAGSPFDLAFNATVIARIALARAHAGARDALAADALALAGAHAIDPHAMSGLCDRLREGPSLRFALDLVARALAWGLDAALETRWSGVPPADWDTLYATLSQHDGRSHPTELVARHLGEYFRRADKPREAERWFALSLSLCSEAPPDSTLRRFAPFTERLRASPHFVCEGPSGGVLNPTFEYR